MAKRGVRRYLEEDDTDAMVYNHLTDDEADLCRNVVTFGPDYLRSTKKWTAARIKDFLGRSEIKREVEMLRRQYEDRGGLQERTQFFAQLRVNGMVPAALSVLARALRGEYVDSSGDRKAAPTPQQLDAAKEVLERANIQGGKWAGNDSVPQIDARSVQIAIGGSVDHASMDAKGREKVRNILNTVMNRTRALSSNDRRKEVVKDAEQADDE